MKKLLLLVVVAAGCASSSNKTEPLVGRARFVDSEGKASGDASLYQSKDVVTNLPNVPAGDHGFHFHAIGKCTGPAFDSAGGHFNPTQKKHGRLNPEGSHVGDLGNVNVGPAGADIVVANVEMSALFDTDGTALVLHAGADDEKTDPSGNSGARIRCGVVERP
jgi:Cu-Zn family superoxide dismutase